MAFCARVGVAWSHVRLVTGENETHAPVSLWSKILHLSMAKVHHLGCAHEVASSESPLGLFLHGLRHHLKTPRGTKLYAGGLREEREQQSYHFRPRATPHKHNFMALHHDSNTDCTLLWTSPYRKSTCCTRVRTVNT